MSKINDTGMIPMPSLIHFNGEECYFKKTNYKFGIYNGFAISLSVLQKLSPEKNILIVYEDKRTGKRERYMTSIRAYLDSEKRYANTDEDIQKIVSIEDMKRVELN